MRAVFVFVASAVDSLKPGSREATQNSHVDVDGKGSASHYMGITALGTESS